MKKPLNEDMVERAKSNGISRKVFYQRVVIRGWDEKIAATEPITRRNLNRKLVRKAWENGVSYQTFQKRVSEYGWSEEKAALTPVMTKAQAGSLGRKDHFDV